MNHRLIRFLLLFAALWLPVQTMAALSAPMCRHAQEQDVAAGMAESGMPCHEAAAAEPVAHTDGCDNCEMCHLASAGFMPSSAIGAGLIPARYGYILPAVMAPPSHIAEPPQHPPRSTT